MRTPTMLAAAALSGLVLGASLGLELTAAHAADPAASSATPSASGSESSTPSSSASSSLSASTSATPSSDATAPAGVTPQAQGSPSPSPTPSATPTPTALWTFTLSTGGADVLDPLVIAGTVQAPPSDSSRPTFAVLERRVAHQWRYGQHVPLSWTGDTATFAAHYSHTKKPGWYVFRLTVMSGSGLTASKVIKLPVKAVIDLVVSGPLTRADVPLTYRAGCPVSPSHLRRIDMNFWSFHKGEVSRGSLIVRDFTVSDIKRIFTRMFAARFPIHKMFPVDRYGGKDVRAMANDDTSAFNCRSVTGNPYRVSQHSYGNALDINTYENPYVTSGHVYPTHHYLKRSPYRTGMILKRRAVARAFARMGWLWGARWSHPDYQHFSSNGG